MHVDWIDSELITRHLIIKGRNHFGLIVLYAERQEAKLITEGGGGGGYGTGCKREMRY